MKRSRLKAAPFPSEPRQPVIPARWAWHHRTLFAARTWLEGKHAERETAIRTAQDRGGADFGDVATEEYENRAVLAKLSFSGTELTEIDAALERIRRGTYGICELTGRRIGAARLRALPWTRWSQVAAARLEKAPDRNGRRVRRTGPRLSA